MKSNILSIATLNNLLDYDARKFVITEMQLKTILPSWMLKANSSALRSVLQRYLDYVQKHVHSLDFFIEEEKIGSLSLINRVMNAFIEETETKLTSCADREVKDACLLGSVQAINHFKISMYGTAAAFARALGKEKAANIFREAESDEKQIDDRLSRLAEHEINIKAKNPILST
ncbi:MAG: hypothetical protein C5B59_03745 [Bacteroidetes bacterium]|nr:MAG: hypothetical protein C5B59_03745 [Bacteroidota bacterium]